MLRSDKTPPGMTPCPQSFLCIILSSFLRYLGHSATCSSAPSPHFACIVSVLISIHSPTLRRSLRGSLRCAAPQQYICTFSMRDFLRSPEWPYRRLMRNSGGDHCSLRTGRGCATTSVSSTSVQREYSYFSGHKNSLSMHFRMQSDYSGRENRYGSSTCRTPAGGPSKNLQAFPAH